jgi:predicted permease
MSYFKRLLSRLRSRRVDGTVDDELSFHLEKEVEQNIARGMSPDEARRQALIAFGGVQQTREKVRRVRWTHFVEVLTQDLRYGRRMLLKSPGFTVIAVLTLALGIGMNSAIFSLIDAVLFRALPAQHPEELVLLKWHARHRAKMTSNRSYGDCAAQITRDNPAGCSLSLPFFHELPSQGLFSEVAAFAGALQLDLSGNGAASIVKDGQFVSGGFFEMLGTKAAAGRLLQTSDDALAASPALVLSYGYWQSAFGGSADAIGKMVRLNGQAFTIVGVAEPAFAGLTPGHRVDLWMPLSTSRLVTPRWTPEEETGRFWWLVIVGRLKNGVTVQQAQSALTLLFQNLTEHAEKPYFTEAEAPYIEVLPAQQGLVGGRRDILQPLYLLMMAVALVLLIACANIAGLLLARSAARSKEIAVRLTLGARRGRLVSQFLVESLLLSTLGGALGVAVAHWGARLLWWLSDRDGSGPPPFHPHLDWRVLGFTAAIAIMTGLLFGLAPALRSLRVDLTPALKTGSGSSDAGTPRIKWYGMGNVLVVAQVSLAIVALVTAGLLVRTLRNLKSADLGFASDHLLVFSLDPILAGYKTNQIDSLNRDLQRQIAALPGVKSVTYSWTSLLRGWEWDTDAHLPGTPAKEAANAHYLPVGPGFFTTMGIPLKAGRDFNAADFAIAAERAARPPNAKPDPTAAPLTVIVNDAFVRRYFPHLNPLGRHIDPGPQDDPNEPQEPGWDIIGVAGDAHYEDVRSEIEPTMYAACAGNASFSVRTFADPLALAPAIRNLINQRDNNLAMSHVISEEQQIDQMVFVEKLVARLSSFFGVLALLLACAGIYGLLSYEVTRRTREIGIRMAIGAQQSDVVSMVVRQGLLVALAGVVIGAGASFAVNGLMEKILYHVRAGDPLTLAAVTAILLVIAVVACFLPARRATRVDPLVALRYE